MKLPNFLKRKQNQDSLKNMSYPRVGISLGASWSWGVSMIATMAFMNTMGILPALVWVIGNILAIPLFGFIKVGIRGFKNWLNFVPFVLFALFIALMAIIINMQALITGLGGGHDIVSYKFLDNNYSVPLVIGLALFVLFFVYKYGLKGDVLSDNGYYILQLGAVVVLAVSSVFQSSFNINPNLELVTQKGIEWVFPLGFLGIVTGVFTDPMMWQRFEQKSEVLKLSFWGAFWFAIYMFFVVLTGLFFRPNLFLGTMLLIVIFALALSTIGSAIVATQFLTSKIGVGKLLGLLFSLSAVISWPLLMDFGMSEIWGIYASYRWKIVTTMIAVSFMGKYVIKKKQKKKILSLFNKVKLYN